jgi:hypothetical protein
MRSSSIVLERDVSAGLLKNCLIATTSPKMARIVQRMPTTALMVPSIIWAFGPFEFGTDDVVGSWLDVTLRGAMSDVDMGIYRIDE